MTDKNRRRADRETVKERAYKGSERRYYDRSNSDHVQHLHIGDCFATNKQNSLLITVLGSCIAACARDADSGIAGMSHFLLPEPPSGELEEKDALRYGSHALPRLTNDLLRLGARKEKLEWKFFGGADVIDQSQKIGTWNVTFIQSYMEKEQISPAGQDLGGKYPRRILYYPDTGKVMVRNLQRSEDFSLVHAQAALASTMTKTRS